MSFKTKSPGMRNFLNNFAKKLYGRTVDESINDKICVMCGQKVLSFSDNLSEKEYYISGLCEFCQKGEFKND